MVQINDKNQMAK